MILNNNVSMTDLRYLRLTIIICKSLQLAVDCWRAITRREDSRRAPRGVFVARFRNSGSVTNKTMSSIGTHLPSHLSRRRRDKEPRQ
jgi:hypothetical protein